MLESALESAVESKNVDMHRATLIVQRAACIEQDVGRVGHLCWRVPTQQHASRNMQHSHATCIVQRATCNATCNMHHATHIMSGTLATTCLRRTHVAHAIDGESFGDCVRVATARVLARDQHRLVEWEIGVPIRSPHANAGVPDTALACKANKGGTKGGGLTPEATAPGPAPTLPESVRPCTARSFSTRGPPPEPATSLPQPSSQDRAKTIFAHNLLAEDLALDT